MKLLLDECLPRKLKFHLPGHSCVTVPEAGWAGKANGELLSLADSAGYHVFITMDRGVEYQQDLGIRRIAVVLMRAKSSRLADLQIHISKVLAVLATIEPGELVSVP